MEFNFGLQKYRFFTRRYKPILSFHQNAEGMNMTSFWKNLQQLAHGQLFNGGYLSPDVARTQAESVIKTETKRNCSNEAVRRPPHPQIAAYR
jgi:hypothetical protein